MPNHWQTRKFKVALNSSLQFLQKVVSEHFDYSPIIKYAGHRF